MKTHVRNSKKEYINGLIGDICFLFSEPKEDQELEKLTGCQSGGLRFEQLWTPNSCGSAKEEEPM